MHKIWTQLLATAALVALSGAAYAADMGIPRKAQPMVAPPPVQDWSGIYVGLEGGYAWGHHDLDPAFDPFFGAKFGGGSRFPCGTKGCTPDASIGSDKQHGWLFGGFAGAQKQWGSWVLGIEADFDGANIKG